MRKILTWLLGTILVLGIAGVIYEQWSRYQASTTYLPAGELVQMPWGKVHLNCRGVRGTSAPTVVLQSGLDLFGSMSWAPIQAEIAQTLRVCAYDRPGILHSDATTAPRDAIAMTDELHELLKQAGEQPPYLLVGHSMGGLTSQVHAGRYADEMHSLVLIDSSHHAQLERLPRELVAAELSEPPPNWLVALASNFGVLRLLDPFPPLEIPASVAPAQQFMPTSAMGVIAEVGGVRAIAAQAAETVISRELPIVVLSRGKEPEELAGTFSPAVIEEAAVVWRQLQAEHAQLSDHGVLHYVEGAGHYVHHDRPDVVIETILNLAGQN